MKIRIVTDQKWKTLPDKIRRCKKDIEKAKKIGTVVIDIEYAHIQPEVRYNRITHRWFIENLYNPEYDATCFLFTPTQGKKWGISQGLGGSQLTVPNTLGLFWVQSHENTVKNRMNNFERIFLHEVSHWFSDILKVKDETHFFDYELKNIGDVFYHYDFSIWGKLNSIYRTLRDIYKTLKFRV